MLVGMYWLSMVGGWGGEVREKINSSNGGVLGERVSSDRKEL